MPYLTADDGVRLHFELEGEGHALFLHLGAGCDSGLWRAAGYVPALASTNLCILFDHRGHGQSDHPTGAEANHIDRYAADVVRVLDHLGVDQASYWGYSNGILVGLRAAQVSPSRVNKLVLSGAVASTRPSQEEIVARSAAAVDELTRSGWETMIGRFDEEESEPVPNWMKARIRATDIKPFIAWWQARPEWNWSALDAAASIFQPALFLAGEREDPDDQVSAVASMMRNARVMRLSGHGHINAFLHSELVLPEVRSFLGDPAA